MEITSQSSVIDLAVVDDNVVRIGWPAIDGGVELFYYQNTGYRVLMHCVKRALERTSKHNQKTAW